MDRPRSLLKRIDATGVPLLLARLAVGGMFMYLAIQKLRDPLEYLKQTRDYHILPADPALWLNLTALVMPWLELTCAIALLLGIGRRGAALIINGMLLFFTSMLFLRALGMYHHPDPGIVYQSFCDVNFNCGCGTGVVFICSKLAENIALQIGALIALFSASHRFCLSAWLGRRPGAAMLQPELAET